MFSFLKQKRQAAKPAKRNPFQAAMPMGGGPEDDLAAQDKFAATLIKGFDPALRSHPQTVIAVLGALAGFAAQISLRETLVATGKLREWDVFKTVEKNGSAYLESPRMDDQLLRMKEWQSSLFRSMSETAMQLGAMERYDTQELLDHVVRSYGKNLYAVPRVDAAHLPLANAHDVLRDGWDPLCLGLKQFDGGQPGSWIPVLSVIARRYILANRDRIDPSTIVPLVVETAIAASRFDPSTICGMSRHARPRVLDVSKTSHGALLASGEFAAAMRNARAA